MSSLISRDPPFRTPLQGWSFSPPRWVACEDAIGHDLETVVTEGLLLVQFFARGRVRQSRPQNHVGTKSVFDTMAFPGGVADHLRRRCGPLLHDELQAIVAMLRLA